jgi:Na+/H+-dicarboxylate symporter
VSLATSFSNASVNDSIMTRVSGLELTLASATSSSEAAVPVAMTLIPILPWKHEPHVATSSVAIAD